MNKKFSTLLASFLLAGGLFNANAESFTDLDLSKKEARSGWYYVYVNNAGAATTANGMLTLGNTNLYEMEKKAADVWQVVAVLDASDNVVGYKLQNQNGKPLEVKVAADGGTTTYNTFIESTSGQYLAFSNTVGFAGDLTAISSTLSTIWQYDLVEAEPQTLTVGELNYYEKDGFSVTIKGKDASTDKYTVALNDNPFAGHLTPMVYDGRNFQVAEDDVIQYYLKNAAGQYIVATKYDGQGFSPSQVIYGLSVVDSTTLKRDINNNNPSYNYKAKFSAEAAINSYKANKQGLTELSNLFVDDVELGRYDFSAVPTLVASQGTALKPIKITLGSGQVVAPKDLLVKGKFYTVKKIEGNVVSYLGIDEEGYADWVADYSNVLEGQWALTYNGRQYVFTNRENIAAVERIDAYNLYVTDKTNVYAQGIALYEIAPVAEHAASDGYKTLNVTETSKFNIGFSSSVFGSTAWMTENHAGTNNHTIGLDIERENASVFTATEYSAPRAKKYVNNILKAYTTDSIYVISTLGYYNAKGEYKTDCKDTLKIVSYSFVNQYGEPLVYNDNARKYQAWIEKDEDGNYTKTAQKFALREDGEKLNLRKLTASWVSGDYTSYQKLGSNDFKMYAGDAANGILSNTGLYERTENDLFVVEATEAPKYRRLVNAIDTVSIYRDENASQLLYEDGAFLGLKNENQFEIAPAMLADVAYAPVTTYKPLYMLAVDATIVPDGKYCPIHGVDATCEHASETKGWVEGRYLVCLADSADAWAKANPSKHAQANPYKYDGMYKLGFVPAIHKNDSLIITHEDEKKVKRYFLGKGAMNPATFAFRYVDEEAGSFVIESHCGYIKWINGNVVLTDEEAEADVFNMNEEEGRTPTANEEIAAEGVTVIAGNGNVTIAGAAGKKVVIANILGQTVANTIIASDNATIAAPAGVVVVKVEGEAAVKAIVK